MALRRIAGIVLLGVLLFAGCAMVVRQPAVEGKRCGDTPQHVILIFLQGIAEFSLRLIKAVIPEGISAFAVFGDGDPKRGQEVVRELLRHPEVSAESETGSTYELEQIVETQAPEKFVVAVRRETEDGQVYTRSFLVRLDVTVNCILNVKPLGPHWTRVR